MIRVSSADVKFVRAWDNAFRAFPEVAGESHRQFSQRWRETHRCRVEPAQQTLPHTYYIFDRDEDYTWFMLRWA